MEGRKKLYIIARQAKQSEEAKLIEQAKHINVSGSEDEMRNMYGIIAEHCKKRFSLLHSTGAQTVLFCVRNNLVNILKVNMQPNGAFRDMPVGEYKEIMLIIALRELTGNQEPTLTEKDLCQIDKELYDMLAKKSRVAAEDMASMYISTKDFIIRNTDHGSNLKMQWLLDILGYDKNYSQTDEKQFAERQEIFFAASKNEQFKIAEGLMQRYIITPQNVNKDLLLGVFEPDMKDIYDQSSLETMKWLHEHFQPEPNDMKRNDFNALVYACEKGKLEKAQWLAETYKLNMVDDEKAIHHAYVLAEYNGSYDVTRWINETFGKMKIVNLVNKHGEMWIPPWDSYGKYAKAAAMKLGNKGK